MPYKLAPNESPMTNPKEREFSVIVLNAILKSLEKQIPGKKYFYKMSFVEKEGLYISENNLKIRNLTRTSWCLPALKLNASPNK